MLFFTWFLQYFGSLFFLLISSRHVRMSIIWHIAQIRQSCEMRFYILMKKDVVLENSVFLISKVQILKVWKTENFSSTNTHTHAHSFNWIFRIFSNNMCFRFRYKSCNIFKLQTRKKYITLHGDWNLSNGNLYHTDPCLTDLSLKNYRLLLLKKQVALYTRHNQDSLLQSGITCTQFIMTWGLKLQMINQYVFTYPVNDTIIMLFSKSGIKISSCHSVSSSAARDRYTHTGRQTVKILIISSCCTTVIKHMKIFHQQLYSRNKFSATKLQLLIQTLV